MRKTIHFTKEDYDSFERFVKTGEYDAKHQDLLGNINIGAINCSFIIREEAGDPTDKCIYGKKHAALDCDINVLKDNKDYSGSAIYYGAPFDYFTGFFVEMKETYEDTLAGILMQIDEIINEDEELKEAAERTDLTWDKLAMQKLSYSIKDQLISIAAVTPFELNKDPWEMTKSELDEAKIEAATYVHWVKSPEYYQSVPAIIDFNEPIPVFEGNFNDLQEMGLNHG